MNHSEPVPLEPEFSQASKPYGRRAFLGLATLGSLGVLIGNREAVAVKDTVGKIAKHDPTGLAAQLPLNDTRWTIFTVTDGYPKRSHAEYRLTVKGLVDRPLDLSYDDIRARKVTKLTRDFQCVTGWRVEGVPWVGVLLADLLHEAGIQPQAKALRFTSFDGEYTESLTLAQALRPDMLVAYQLEGHDITTEHGGPVRLYAAPMYGYKSIKWLDGIEVVEQVTPGYWENEGYAVDAWVGKSNGLNDDPT